MGRDFWVGYLHNGNCDYDQADGKTLQQAVAGNQWTLVASSETSGTVTASCGAWSTTVDLVPGGSVTINVPFETATAMVTRWTRPCYSRQIRNAGIHVTATTDIALYSYNYNTASFDATTVLPTHTLGTRYILNDFDYYTQPGIVTRPDTYDGGEMCIVATENNTTVDIFFHSALQIDTFQFSTSAWQALSHTTHGAGSHFRTLTLQRGQYIQLITPGSYSFAGTEVTSSKPVAVFMGRKRVTVPYARNAAGSTSTSWCCADHIYEQTIPTDRWGKEFVVVPDHRTTNPQHSFFDIVSSEDDCSVTCYTASGTTISVQTLSAGENYLGNMSTDSSPVYISATKPVSVCLYLGSNRFCGNEGDPSSVFIPPLDQATNRAVFFAFDNLDGFSHRTCVVVPTDAVSGMTIDGVDISGQFSTVGTTGFSYARVSITSGLHTLLNTQGRFNAWFYGMAGAGSYAYTAAMGLRNLQYELFVDGDNTYTWGDTIATCQDRTHHFKIETEGDIDTRWYIDNVLQSSTDTALETTFSPGLHSIMALQRGSCSTPNYCDTLRLTVCVGIPTSGMTTVYDTVDADNLPRVYNGDIHYLSVSDSIYYLVNVTGCDSAVRYNLYVRRPACPAQTSMGRDYWVMFPYNAYDYGNDNTRALSLIASGDNDATITIQVGPPSDPVWSTTANLVAGGYVEVEVPQWATRIPTNIVENHGIHVTSTADISLYSSNYIYQSYDIATVLPTGTLGCRYIVQDYPGSSLGVEDDAGGSEIGIVATEDNTLVQVNLSASDRYHSAGETFTFTLNAGYDFQLLSNHGNTFSGTEIISTTGKPIAVFQGTRITRVPDNSVCCGDYLYEQAIPIEYWGKDFIIVPEHRNLTDLVRITSSEDNCHISLDGAPIAVINAGETYQIGIGIGAAHRLTTTKPVTVFLYFSGGSGGDGDPASVIIPPIEQSICSATIYAHNTTRTNSHYANIVTKTAQVAGMHLNGSSIASQFIPLAGTEYSYAQVSIAPGTHILASSTGTFSAWFYGTGTMESYAYSAGMALTRLNNVWAVGGSPRNRTGDTITVCHSDSVEFAITPSSEDHAVRWYVDDMLQTDYPMTLRYRFMPVADTHTVMAVMHGDCAPNWCDTFSIVIISHVPQSDIFASVPDTISWHSAIYDEGGNYVQTYTAAANGCDSLEVLHLTVTGFPDNVFDVTCSTVAPANAFEMVKLYDTPATAATMSVPMVADMNGDGLPEIIACKFFGSQSSSADNQYRSNGICVYNGQTGEALYSFSTATYSLSGQGVCLADVDADGSTEVIILCHDRKVRCYSATGTLLWTSVVIDKRYLPTVADIMGDGHVQVVCGPYIFDAQTGILLLHGATVASGTGYNPMINASGFEEACVFSLGDIDSDGTQEICAGRAIYKPTLTNYSSAEGNTWTTVRQADSDANIVSYDGQTVVLDFDGDGDLDICVIGVPPTHPYSVSSTRFDTYVWEGQTSSIVASASYTLNTRYGATIPYCGDLDGNGTPEIVYALSGTNGGMMAYTYDPTVAGKMSLMHRHEPFSETAGFTVFDFNQDGRNEIVYRGMEYLYVIDGTTLSDLTTPQNAYSGTHMEYPIVADVNGDGHAEIIISRSDYAFTTANWNHARGHISVYGSTISGAWSSARKVWNQYAYNSVNINEDLTVPQHPLSPAYRFTNGSQPFNKFLGQLPYIDTEGNLFNVAADIVASSASATMDGDSVRITLEYSNQGDADLLAPYGITVYKNEYRGVILQSDTLTQSLSHPATQSPSPSVTHTIAIPRSVVCSLATDDSLIIALNDLGVGIAQHGNTHHECDTTNNTITVQAPWRNSTFDTIAVVCDSIRWRGELRTTDGDYSRTIINAAGCDSVETLYLTVNNSFLQDTFASVPDTIVWRDSVYHTSTVDTLHFTTANGCDSLYILHLTVTGFPDNVFDVTCTQDVTANPWSAQILHQSSRVVHNFFSPVVGDIDGDGVVEIVVVKYEDFTYNTNHGKGYAKTINVYRGTDLGLIRSFSPDNKYLTWGFPGTIALVRYPDGSGGMQGAILVHSTDCHIRSYDINGTLLNTSDVAATGSYGNISVTDFNQDGWPEVYVGNVVYDAATLTRLCAGPSDGNKGIDPLNVNSGSGGAVYQVAMSYASDVTGDGKPELVCGNTIYSVNIASRTNVSLNSITTLNTVTPPSGLSHDGHVAVADFNQDGRMDVLVHKRPYVYAYDPVTGELLFENNTTTDPMYGYPLIGDIDGDGNLEMAFITIINSNSKLVALKYTPGIGLQTKFRANVDDGSSGRTGMTLFDFNQDGIMEIVYRDEQKIRIINASGKSHRTGNDTVSLYNLYALSMTSGTASEYPIVADVNNDGAAEIVVVGDLNKTNVSYIGNLVVIGGIQPWAPARKVWNQYMYNATNINEDLTVPSPMFNNAHAFVGPDNIVRRPFNNFLQQQTTLDLYGRPFVADADIVANSATAILDDDTVRISVEYANQGDADLQAPYGITVYKNTYRGDILWIDTVRTPLNSQLSILNSQLSIPRSIICSLAENDSLLIAFNDLGTGIAQHGNTHPECDTTNNIVTVQAPWRNSTFDTTIVACDSFAWNGTIFSESNPNFQFIALNSVGCDSIETLHLTVNYSSTNTAPGATQSLFSVSATHRVRFSPGNLQFKASTRTWRFAPNQYTYIGTGGANTNPTSSATAWIDLFGYGTSGWNSGATVYQPWGTNTTGTNYYPGGNAANTLTGAYAEADWAWHNIIYYGGTATPAHIWRTMTTAEWTYLITERDSASYKYGVATVNGNCGVVILPDYWRLPTGLTFTPGTGAYTRNVYTAAQWTLMENAGAVFLPAAGYRNNKTVSNHGTTGYYWTVDNNGAVYGYCMTVNASVVNPANYSNRRNGFSLRPVYDIYSDTSVTACDSFTWYDSTYTASTYNATHTFTNAAGCDSVVTLHLTIRHSSTGDTTAVACDSLTWWATGETYTADTTLNSQFSILNSQGCDSTVTLNLTVRYSSSFDTTAVVCDSLNWRDSTYTASTTHVRTISNAVGCDSTVTLNLTVNYSFQQDTFASEPDTLVWHDSIYRVSTIDTLGEYGGASRLTVNGCDSLHILHLTVTGFPDNVMDVTCTQDVTANPWNARVLRSANGVHNYFTPAVGDIDGDGVVEIVVAQWTNDNLKTTAEAIRVFRGTDLQVICTINIPQQIYCGDRGPYALVRYPNGSGDMQGAIIVHCKDNKLRSYSISGTLLNTSDVDVPITYGAVFITDFNQDGWPEVCIGNTVYDASTLKRLCSGPADGNTGSHSWSSVSVAANVVGDFERELICGNTIYRVNIASRTDPSQNSVSVLKTITPPAGVLQDGFTITADFDLDGRLDIMVVRVHDNTAHFYAYNPDTEDILFTYNLNCEGVGFPLVGDIDGDGNIEFVFIDEQNSVTNARIRGIKYKPGIGPEVMFAATHTDRSGATSMTLFDFNQDGIMEIVYRDETLLRIINASGKSHRTGNDTVSFYNLYSMSMTCGTGYEYPVVADVNNDGAAEIVTCGKINSDGTNWKGQIVVLGGNHPWAPARKVWNQFMYNVTNINEDLTVPSQMFNNAHAFVGPDNVVRRPFNNFLQQQTTLDRYGRPFTAAADVVVSTASATMGSDDTVRVTVEYTNQGDADLEAPYGITVYNNVYRGQRLWTDTITQPLTHSNNQAITHSIAIPRSIICSLATDDNVVIALNDLGNGIAQHGGTHPECDTTNNIVTLIIPWRNSTYDTTAVACDSLRWRGELRMTDGDYTRTIINAAGCDSVETLHLTVNYSSTNTTPGATQSLFSVSATHRVRFSPGNLQFQASTGTWRFAPNQYTYIGTGGANTNPTSSATAWIDLFGYGTSGWNSGTVTNYQPWSTSTTNNQYYPGSNAANTLTGDYAEADWAWHNTISGGGDETHVWRTMTSEEWTYLFSGRDSASYKYGSATVDGVHGMIILPDYWRLPSGLTFTPGTNGWTMNNYTLSQWEQLEDSGAVFLPASGYRTNKKVSLTGTYGHYWSVSNDGTAGNASDMYFGSNIVTIRQAVARSYGFSIRPVYDIYSDTSVTACDSFTWYDSTYTASTYNATHTFTNAAGCDSVVTLHLTIRHSSTGDTTAVACDSLTWWATGETYTADTTFNAQLPIFNSQGCDSTVTLNLTIRNSSSFDTTAVVCDSLNWRDSTYTESTIHVRTISNAVECDSTVTLNLTVNNSFQQDTFAFVPDTMVWYDSIYRVSTIDTLGEYGDVSRHTVSGCDSLHILYLTVTGYPDNVFDIGCKVGTDSNTFEMVRMFDGEGVASNMGTPMVADLDGDGVPEIVVPKYYSSDIYASNGLLVHDGRNGVLKYTINTDIFSLNAQTITLADIDHDGHTEVFLTGNNYRLCCYNYDGSMRWSVNNAVDHRYILYAADIMGDGHVEIVCGPYIYNAETGALLLHGALQDYGTGMNIYLQHSAPSRGNHPYLYTLGDINNDGTQELCAGNTVYDITITNYNDTSGNNWSTLMQAESKPSMANYDGPTALIDFDQDGDLDICVIGAPHSITNSTTTNYTVNPYVWDGQTPTIIAQNTKIVYARHGPTIPYCGDLDGNGSPEIVFSIGNEGMTTGLSSTGMFAYTYDPTVSGNMRLMHQHLPFAETAGFTVFDFNQDGKNEIIYRGTEKLFIVDGASLDTLTTPIAAYSGTIREYPVVADVNGDGHAEIVITQGNISPSYYNGYVSVYGSAIPGAWSSARKVWNQYMYNSVNINEDLTVPQHPLSPAYRFPNGKQPFNKFLGQQPYIDPQGNSFNLAADITYTGTDPYVMMDGDTVRVTVEYTNQGDADLEAPYGISVYKNEYRGQKLWNDTLMVSDLNVDDTISHTIVILRDIICTLEADDSLVIALNDLGDGIAQHGNTHPECDTTNNIVYIKVVPICANDDYAETYELTYVVVDPLANDRIGCEQPSVSIITQAEHGVAVVSGGANEGVNEGNSELGDELGDTGGSSTPPPYVSPVVVYTPGQVCVGEFDEMVCTPFTGIDSVRIVVYCGDDVDTSWLFITVHPATDTSAIVCDSLIWYDTVISHSGEYLHTLTSVSGQDSILRLHLTVNHSTTGTDTLSACDSYTWIDGITYTASNSSATHTLNNADGCDSVVTLNLTIGTSTTGTDTLSACDSYTWIDGITYTASNSSASHTLNNADGCDSVVTLNLTVFKSVSAVDSIESCKPIVWIDSQTYSSPATTVYTVQTIHGCDSIVTLILHKPQPEVTYIADSICTGSSYIFGGRILSEEGTYYDTLEATDMCDSVVSLTLTILLRPTVKIDVYRNCDASLVRLQAVTNAPYFEWSIESHEWNSTYGDRHDSILEFNPNDEIDVILYVDYGPNPTCPATDRVGLSHWEPHIAQIYVSPEIANLESRTIYMTGYNPWADTQTWYLNGIRYTYGPRAEYLMPYDDDSLLVTLVASDSLCADTANKTVYMNRGEIYVPNIFTPGAENNNSFIIGFYGIVEFEIHIYNRYGLLVYHNTDMETFWDGTDLNGNPCPTGAYVYAIHYRRRVHSREWHMIRGTVTLLR